MRTRAAAFFCASFAWWRRRREFRWAAPVDPIFACCCDFEDPHRLPLEWGSHTRHPHRFCRLLFAFKPSVLHLRIGLQRFVLITACTQSCELCGAWRRHYSLLSQSTKLAQATPTRACGCQFCASWRCASRGRRGEPRAWPNHQKASSRRTRRSSRRCAFIEAGRRVAGPRHRALGTAGCRRRGRRRIKRHEPSSPLRSPTPGCPS